MGGRTWGRCDPPDCVRQAGPEGALLPDDPATPVCLVTRGGSSPTGGGTGDSVTETAAAGTIVCRRNVCGRVVLALRASSKACLVLSGGQAAHEICVSWLVLVVLRFHSSLCMGGLAWQVHQPQQQQVLVEGGQSGHASQQALLLMQQQRQQSAQQQQYAQGPYQQQQQQQHHHSQGYWAS